ncbi:growth-regulating factor 7-like [Wolffia australiana]
MEFGTVMGIDGLVSSSSEMGVYRSGQFKHGRVGESEENDWMALKTQRSSEGTIMAQVKPSQSLFPDGQQMLSFSSPKQDSLMPCNDGGLAYYQASGSSFPLQSSPYARNAGLRGPFTPSQWMELEHQALIYKYIDANVPVPSSLLIAIRKSLGSSGFPSYSPGSIRAAELGWNPFHLGFSANADPEPGRCRRTDGKKWRCSRDAVVDQKYCERHMNRGRHRSRKPVEGHSGHAAKPVPIVSPPSQSNNNSSNSSSLSINKPLPSKPTSATSTALPYSRIGISKESANGNGGSLFASSQASPLRHFFDDWPKTQSGRSVAWPEVEDVQSERTQLSISIPMGSSEFSSSPSSPTQESTGCLTSKAQREASWIPISWESSLGGPLGEVLNKTASKTSSGYAKNPNSSSMNFIAEAWDSTSPCVGSSPTGVLQKSMAFASLSGSTGSSPRADVVRTANDSTGSLCDSLLGSTLVNSTSIRTL